MQTVWHERVAARQAESLYRKRRITDHLPHDDRIFCRNDYLGLAQHPHVVAAFQNAAAQYGVGGMSSQLVVGHRDIHKTLEGAFADFLGRDAALLFSCGYMANIGVLSAVAHKNDQLILDKYVHASLVDAAKLSDAERVRFPHKDYEQLEVLLATPRKGHRFIVTDSVFSMQGDMADLNRCAALAAQYDSTLIVDDAHGLGILGAHGGGAIEHFNLNQTQLPIVICPLGKALGVMGAVVAGSSDLIDYLIQFARPYIYTTAIPPALAAAALASLDILKKETWRREKLMGLIAYFKQRAAELDLPVCMSNTPIQYIALGEAAFAQHVSTALFERGIILHAMRPPSVPAHLSGLRITLSCLHEPQAIDFLLSNLRDIIDVSAS